MGPHDYNQQCDGRKPRSCSELCKPVSVFLILLINGISFFILIAVEKFEDSKSFMPAEIVNSAFYSLIWLLTTWSLLMIVRSEPGFVQNNYRYIEDKMSDRDRLLYERLRNALHSTH